MAAVNEAWRVLSDPARRVRYDAGLRAGEPRPSAGRGGSTGSPGVGDEADWIAQGWVAPEWDGDEDDHPLSTREARAAHRLGLTFGVVMVVVAVLLAALFVYAFVRSASLRPA